ncbi:MAG: hypothetical protein EOO53_15260 [Gammaproteobacteria bacterium]|nr:MAG: hypothetical protein EOO53_15260 [Gammaproteobacteria bacterium]
MKKIIIILVSILISSCATQVNYSLQTFYKSKNSKLNLIAKLTFMKNGNYLVCTTSSDHENEDLGNGSYYCIEGVWSQTKNIVTFTPNTYEGKLLSSVPENGDIEILEKSENLANPQVLSMLQFSGSTMTNVSVGEANTKSSKGWSNYQRIESP